MGLTADTQTQDRQSGPYHANTAPHAGISGLPPILAFVTITRPFTLLPPFLGIVSGSLAALGSMAATGRLGFLEGLHRYWAYILIGGIMSATLNAASNVLNQVTEVEVDRRNKPNRVLPRGLMSVNAALGFAIVLYALALGLAWWIEPIPGQHATFWCALVAALATVLYSTKPLYLKSRGWWANVTIAIPRGCLLKVAGWGCVASVLDAEPWFIGLVFMLFLFGASSSKDFSDTDGDREAGIRTLPVIYGTEKTARLIAPFFILPWFVLAVGALLPGFWQKTQVLHSNVAATCVLGLALAAYGVFIAGVMRRQGISTDGNHPAWKHMYLMMMAAQIGLVLCYLV